MPTPFDAQIAGLFADPTFAMGASLYGDSRQPNSTANAFGLMQQMMQAKQNNAYKDRELNQQQTFQTGQLQHMTAQEKVAEEQFQRQQALADQQLAMERQKMDMQNKFMEQVGGMFGPAGKTSAPTAPPAGTPGKYGTPSHILDGLERTESGGNPLAVGPAIPGSSERALGAYQFLPSTVDTLKQQGIKFNPFDKAQSRDAADQYLQQLVAQNGGDMNKALAAYGGFKTKDPSAYIAKVMGGAPAPQIAASAPQPPQAVTAGGGGPAPQQGGGPNPLQIAQMGAMAGIAGVPGGQGLIEVGKMMQPQPVAAGGYMRDPSTGAMTYLPDPSEAQRRQQQQQTVDYNTKPTAVAGLPQKEADQIKTRQFEEASKTIDESRKLHAEVPNQIMAIRRARDDIEQMVSKPGPMGSQLFMGKGGDSKLAITKLFANTFGYPADPNVMRAEDFDSAMAQLWMKAVKQVDQNPTANQQKSIMQAFGTRTNDPSALPRILAETEKSLTKVANIHNQMVDQYSKSTGTPYPIDRSLNVVPAPPKRGTVKSGYMYNGSLTSDPRDPQNWVPVPQGGK